MLINKVCKIRIYPNKEQAILIAKTIGCSRFVFNHFLAEWNSKYEETGKGLSYNKCSAQLPGLKESLPWLKEVDSIALQSSLRNLDDAFQCFFRNQAKAPRFKSKKNQVQSYTTKFTNSNIATAGNCVKLPKLGLVFSAKHQEISDRILSATVRATPSLLTAGTAGLA